MPQAAPSKLPFVSVAGATTALVLLTALNFVNYIDRYILPGVQEMVKHEFSVSDERIGALVFWFMLAYVLASPVTGWIGDHFPRKPLIVGAALFCSGVNFFTATVHTFDTLMIRHAALGLGEACFGIFGPVILADFYPDDQRNRVLTIFNVALPVGAALGYLIGGSVGGHYGWRMPFYVSAVPGVVVALLILFFMKEPKRGASEVEKPKLEKDAVLALVKNPAYVTAVLGLAMVTFSLGGISWWMPSFLQRVGGRSPASAGFLMGAITVVTGILGAIVGGWIAQRWSRTNHRALYLVPAWSALLAVPPSLVCFFGPKEWILPMLAAAQFFIFLGTGPLNAATVNSVGSGVRATALAGQLFFIHVLGDAPSPRIIGLVSDHSNLNIGLGVTLVTFLIAAALLFVGARYAPPLHHEEVG
ncbi:spinster family MFS transporter [Granulicella arctica]|uniref:Putative MFS family arabinose efflux permease n=1 Tax=Granulicella arctica TaxID=940613 RepID=A0A7Y9PJ24_9BACT|nr:MFS transporter [Granulicella arctica]NYF80828.1 putative MFS family arabinose efflux permease [Granulicella arctica]